MEASCLCQEFLLGRLFKQATPTLSCAIFRQRSRRPAQAECIRKMKPMLAMEGPVRDQACLPQQLGVRNALCSCQLAPQSTVCGLECWVLATKASQVQFSRRSVDHYGMPGRVVPGSFVDSDTGIKQTATSLMFSHCRQRGTTFCSNPGHGLPTSALTRAS